MKYTIDLREGDIISIEVMTDKETKTDIDKWEVEKVYRNFVKCRKKVLGGYIKRCVCLGDLVRYGYAKETSF